MALLRVDEALECAATRLRDRSESARLDVEVLLAHVLGKTRTWLYTWNDHVLTQAEFETFEALIQARSNGEPVAYLTGQREFWGLMLDTNASTLIPRPDTETLVQCALDVMHAPTGCVLDLGTGTGAVALALKSERPGWQVSAVDRVDGAVALAHENARRLGLEIAVTQSDWFKALAGERFDLIVSNPPYIDANDAHLERGDVRFEPHSALIASNEGYRDLEYLIEHARAHLNPQGFLMLEHGFAQGERVRGAFERMGYSAIETLKDLAGQPRVTRALWPARKEASE
ncbi:peptide chain release factor N(5)-glutamine methyltransferase [Larsenimonas suaedae]|uniref:peptide chain release factor N(5)-glutamine methyltransferase n=1 Tax=Larsenimonas suaedae TaxID=1851019 RepID=UPI00286C90E6|nr:peptide chain release factor N(5)-glutamine methyltransferase [Larsenimonas suaedae]